MQIGSGFRTKGLDRSLRAIAALPIELKSRIKFFVIGQDNPSEYISQAQKLDIAHIVTFFSGRDDVPRFLQGSDVLLHPSYAENTGGVILEALVAGLPLNSFRCVWICTLCKGSTSGNAVKLALLTKFI